MANMMTDMMNRADTARSNLIRSIVELSFTTDEATLIYQLYLNHKVIKLQWGIGSYRISHGAMLSPESLRTALVIAQTDGPKPIRRRSSRV